MIWFLIASLAANLILALGLVAIGSSYIEQREFNGYLQSQNDLLSEQLTDVMTAALEYIEEEDGDDEGHFGAVAHFDT